MSRFFSQIAAVFFLILTVVGVIIGVASRYGQGDIARIPFYFTWVRDIFDVVCLIAFVACGFALNLHVGRRVVAVLAVVLLVVGLGGGLLHFVHVHEILGFQFSFLPDAFYSVIGGLAGLAALGTLEAPPPGQRSATSVVAQSKR